MIWWVGKNICPRGRGHIGQKIGVRSNFPGINSLLVETICIIEVLMSYEYAEKTSCS
jgi:hypothetical protein